MSATIADVHDCVANAYAACTVIASNSHIARATREIAIIADHGR